MNSLAIFAHLDAHARIHLLTPAQCTAARKLLDWSATRLAERSGVSTQTVINYERNEKRTNRATVRALRNTLEENGIAFDGSDSEEPNAYITQCILSDGTRVRRIGEPK